ncbi:hypothetical protein XELAEV_18022630mg [Xenopus laevis]|uniref:Uncharacterized protein n=1 Tax=Xenopus laevis TaxID=8355 RepID=A0A974D593_XENLA|nr:hypothetical protein XELAEV_18022630mg [Xenopus laevis]
MVATSCSYRAETWFNNYLAFRFSLFQLWTSAKVSCMNLQREKTHILPERKECAKSIHEKLKTMGVGRT